MSNPVANMQQLVSHWSTIMPPPTNSKKRGRDSANNCRVTKLKTQGALYGATTAGPPHETPTNNASSSNATPVK